MATPVYVLTINGVTIKPLKLGFDIREVANGRNRLSASIYSASGVPPIALFDSVSLTEDGVVIFGGYVDAPSEAGAGGQPITPTITTVSAADWNQLAERRSINLYFAAGTLKSQILTLLGTFDDVTLDPTQPDGPLMPEWAAIYWRADDVLNQLTTLSGGYLWNVDYSRVLSMRLASARLAPVQITDANRVAIGDVTVTPSAENYANRVQLLYGGDGVDATDDRYTGDGTTSVFPIRNQHFSNVGYVTNNGVNETLGDGTATWTITGGGWTLTRNTGAPAAGAAIVFTYNAQFPTLIGATAPGGVPTPPGLWEVILRAPDVKHYDVALPMATHEVAVRSRRPRTIVYRTFERGLHPGQSQTISKSPRHLAGVACVISEVTIRNATGRDADRIVTAIEGTQFPGTWRDTYKAWNDTGGGAASFVSGGGGGGGGGGGTIGPGSPGTIAIWTGVNAIGDSVMTQSGGAITVSGNVTAPTFIGDFVGGYHSGSGALLINLNASMLATGTVPVARLPQFVGGDVTTAAPGSVNLQLGAGVVGAGELAPGAVTGDAIADGSITSGKIMDGTIQAIDLADGSVTTPKLADGAVTNAKIGASVITSDKIADGTITNADISATAAIAWTKIDKSGATLGDFGGTLAWAQLPTGAGTWTGTPTISGSLTVSAHLYGLTPYSQDVGQLSQKFRAIHAAELWVETLVAQATAATIGGRVLIGPTTILKRNVAPGDSSIYVKHNSLQLQILELGSKLILESNGRFEVMAVTSIATPSAEPSDGSFKYTVARAIAGTAATWYAGESVFDTGKTGNGFIDLYSIAGVATPSAGGPTIVGNVRFGDLALDWAPRWAVGNLRGLYHYSSDVYGFAAGDKDASNLVIDAANGVRIRTGAVVYAQLAAGVFTLGLPTGNRLQWNGTDLVLVTPTVSITPGLGISIVPNTVAVWENMRAYSFAGADGRFGVHGWDVGADRTIFIQAEHTGAANKDAQVFISAHCHPQGGADHGAQWVMKAAPTTSYIYGIANAFEFQLTPDVSTNYLRLWPTGAYFAKQIEAGGGIRAKGTIIAPDPTGLALELEISGGEGLITARDRTAGTGAPVNLICGAAQYKVTATAHNFWAAPVYTTHFIQSDNWGRFKGWGGGGSGLAIQVGISGGSGYIDAYDLTAGAYAPLNVRGTVVNLSNGPVYATHAIQSDSWGRFKGWGGAGTGLALEVGISGGQGYVMAYDRTTPAYGSLNLLAGAAALTLRSDGYLFMVGSTRQTAGHYLYPGSVSGLSDNQSSYYLASHSVYGLYTNSGMYFGGGLTCVGGAQVLDTNGEWRPDVDNNRKVGVPTHRYNLIRGVTITPGDLLFENGYAFTEAEKVGIAEPGIALVNPDGDVIAFFGATGLQSDVPHVRTTPDERAGMDRHPERRVVGYDGDRPVYGTRAARPMPDPATARRLSERNPNGE